MHGKIIEIAERLLILSELQKLGEKNVSHSTEKILFSDTCDMLALVVGEVRPRDIVAREKIDALALELGLRDPSASKKLKIDSITSCHSGAGINIPNPKTNAVLRSGGDVPPSTIISPQPSTRNQTQEPVNNEKSLSENFQVIKVVQPEQITPTEEKEIPNLEDMKNREAIHKIQCENGGRSGGTSNTQNEPQVTNISNPHLESQAPCPVCNQMERNGENLTVCGNCRYALHLSCLKGSQKVDDSLLKCPSCQVLLGSKNVPPGSIIPISAMQGKEVQEENNIVSADVTNVAALVETSRSKPDGIVVQSKRLGPPELLPSHELKKNDSGEDPAVMRCGGIGFSWLGKCVVEKDNKMYYKACVLPSGQKVFLRDHVLFRPESSETLPYIARIQSMWEEMISGEKWCRVSWCYYPADLPPLPNRPERVQPNEIIESNHCDDNLLGSVWKTCIALQERDYKLDAQARAQMTEEGKNQLPPLYLTRFQFDVNSGTYLSLPS